MRPLALVPLAVVVLAVPASAVAKGVSRAEVCGADGCVAVKGAEQRNMLLGGTEQIDPPKPAPFYRVVVEMQHGGDVIDTVSQTYVPSAGAIRMRGEGNEIVWWRLELAAKRALDATVAGSRPYPASRIGAMGKPLSARVDSVYCPACGAGDNGGGGVPLWPFVAGGATLALLAAGRVAARRIRVARVSAR